MLIDAYWLNPDKQVANRSIVHLALHPLEVDL